VLFDLGDRFETRDGNRLGAAGPKPCQGSLDERSATALEYFPHGVEAVEELGDGPAVPEVGEPWVGVAPHVVAGKARLAGELSATEAHRQRAVDEVRQTELLAYGKASGRVLRHVGAVLDRDTVGLRCERPGVAGVPRAKAVGADLAFLHEPVKGGPDVLRLIFRNIADVALVEVDVIGLQAAE